MHKKELLLKQIKALKENKCWVHGDELMRGVTEPSYGLPSGYHSEAQKQFPYHGLFVDFSALV